MWNLTGRFLQCNVGAEFRDTVFNRWWVVVRKILCYVIAKCNNGWMSTHFLSPWPFTFDLFESKPITDQYSSTSSCQPNSVTYYIVVVVWLICRTEACGHSSEKMNAKCRQLCRELKWLLEEQITIKMYPCASMFPYHEDQFKCVCVFLLFVSDIPCPSYSGFGWRWQGDWFWHCCLQPVLTTSVFWEYFCLLKMFRTFSAILCSNECQKHYWKSRRRQLAEHVPLLALNCCSVVRTSLPAAAAAVAAAAASRCRLNRLLRNRRRRRLRPSLTGHLCLWCWPGAATARLACDCPRPAHDGWLGDSRVQQLVAGCAAGRSAINE